MKSKNQDHQVVIIGAGLAGLSAAYELTKAGKQVVVIEKEDAVGGLARTININGFSFDTGPHRWYTKNDMVNNWMLQLMGDEVIKVPRLTRIYFDKKFFNYPVQIKSTLMGMGIWKTALAVFDYFRSRISHAIHPKEPVTIEEGYIDQFGKTLFDMFFRRYTEKLWGTSCKNISADWLGQRTRGLNISTVIKNTLFNQKKVVSFVDEFSYPEKGIGRIAQKLASGVTRGGGKIFLSSQVTGINHDNYGIKSVIIKQKNTNKEIPGNEFVSTMPVSELINDFLPKVPENISAVNHRLKYRDEIQVVLFVNKTKITPDTWIYVHPYELPFVRFMEMDNWSRKLSPPGTTSVVFEVVCNYGDSVWQKSDKELYKWISQKYINEFKLITESDIRGYYIYRSRGEYPVYHIGYREDLTTLKGFLRNFSNLQIAGRNGIFRYNNMDHSIEMGLYAAWNIIEGERKFNIESVNIDKEYLEEKKVAGKEMELLEDQHVENG